MNTKHTQGPWHADREGNIWRRHPSDLYQNGGSVAGDRALASVHRGWYGKDETGFPVEANARLIAAAPELLEALKEAVDFCHAMHEKPRITQDWKALIAKATGEQA